VLGAVLMEVTQEGGIGNVGGHGTPQVDHDRLRESLAP
jgi:hypothetical protein